MATENTIDDNYNM